MLKQKKPGPLGDDRARKVKWAPNLVKISLTSFDDREAI